MTNAEKANSVPPRVPAATAVAAVRLLTVSMPRLNPGPVIFSMGQRLDYIRNRLLADDSETVKLRTVPKNRI
jgi:hypothetical protein